MEMLNVSVYEANGDIVIKQKNGDDEPNDIVILTVDQVELVCDWIMKAAKEAGYVERDAFQGEMI